MIGVFVNQKAIEILLKQDPNSPSYDRMFELAQASHETNTTLYFFSTAHFNIDQETVLGTYWDQEDGNWKQRDFPPPDVLYDRSRASGPAAVRIRQYLDAKKVLKVNATSTFNKWDVYKKLHLLPEISSYLPVTRLYREEEDLTDFLNNHDRVYLKGLTGGRGRWIFNVARLPDGGYQYRHFVDQPFVGTVPDLQGLLQEIHNFFGNRPFLIQQAIDLIQLNGNNVDFRAEVQRNGSGELGITGIAARISQSNAPITIKSTAMRIDKFFMESMQYSEAEYNQLERKIHQFLFTIYDSIEQVYGRFGELGLDFGIDTSGEIWFIEPNSKSAKVSLQKAYDQTSAHKVFVNPLEYAKLLYAKGT